MTTRLVSGLVNDRVMHHLSSREAAKSLQKSLIWVDRTMRKMSWFLDLVLAIWGMAWGQSVAKVAEKFGGTEKWTIMPISPLQRMQNTVEEDTTKRAVAMISYLGSPPVLAPGIYHNMKCTHLMSRLSRVTITSQAAIGWAIARTGGVLERTLVVGIDTMPHFLQNIVNVIVWLYITRLITSS
jgi:hypothetical protein